ASPHAVNCSFRTASRSGLREGNDSEVCPDVNVLAAQDLKGSCGGSDLEGKQNRRPEQQGMTTAPKYSPYRRRCTDFVPGRRCPNGGKADVPREVTSVSTSGTAGVGVQASGERSAEITSGRSRPQLGLTATGKDPPYNTRRRWEEAGLAREPVVAVTAA